MIAPSQCSIAAVTITAPATHRYCANPSLRAGTGGVATAGASLRFGLAWVILGRIVRKAEHFTARSVATQSNVPRRLGAAPLLPRSWRRHRCGRRLGREDQAVRKTHPPPRGSRRYRGLWRPGRTAEAIP